MCPTTLLGYSVLRILHAAFILGALSVMTAANLSIPAYSIVNFIPCAIFSVEWFSSLVGIDL